MAKYFKKPSKRRMKVKNKQSFHCSSVVRKPETKIEKLTGLLKNIFKVVKSSIRLCHILKYILDFF